MKQKTLMTAALITAAIVGLYYWNKSATEKKAVAEVKEKELAKPAPGAGNIMADQEGPIPPMYAYDPVAGNGGSGTMLVADNAGPLQFVL